VQANKGVIMKNKSAIELLKLLKSSLKEDYNQELRWNCIEEIQRRGLSFFKELGWGISENSVYKNRYTADEETLRQIYDEGCHRQDTFDKWLLYDLPFLAENWLPKENWVKDECFDEYLPENKLTAWI